MRTGTKITKADNGHFYITWSENRRSHRRSTGTKDRSLAEKAMAEFILAAPKPNDLPVCVALDRYWEDHGSKVESWERTDIAMRHLKSYFGPDSMVGGVDRAAIDKYKKARNDGTIGRRASAGTLRRELGILTTAFNHAGREKLIDKNVIPYVPLPESPAAKDRWLTRSEAEAFLVAANGRTKLFISIALETASRKTAILRLMWPQIDLDRRLINFNPPGRVQTKKRRISCPISDALYPVLVEAQSVKSSEYVLGSIKSIRTGFDAACRRAGLEGVSPHVLRHTWATWAAQDGVQMEKIAAILGDSLEVVVKRYVHWSPDYLRDAVNRERVTPPPAPHQQPSPPIA